MNQAELNIREATFDDLNDLVVLWMQLMKYHQDQATVFQLKDDNQQAEIANILKSKLSDEKCRIFIAHLKSKAVGFIICSFNQGSSAFLLNRKGYIAETIVHEDFRGSQIGGLLYNEAESWLKSHKVDHIQLQVSIENRKGQNFWKDKGFAAVTYLMNKEL